MIKQDSQKESLKPDVLPLFLELPYSLKNIVK